MEKFKAWFAEHLGVIAQDIAQHGADCGFQYITYVRDCVNLYDKFEKDIWAMLWEDSDMLGYKNPMLFVATFKRSDLLENPDSFKNLLVWYACERLAQEYVEESESCTA